MKVIYTTLIQGLLAAFFLAALSTGTLAAAEVKIFRGDSRETVAKGTLDALSLDPLGALELARRVERLAMPEEPFVFAAASHPDGWVLGTGNSGKVVLIGRDGRVEELFTAPEPEVFAVASAADGTVYAGTSPHGKVYRIAAGAEAEALFEPGQAYIWDLALDRDGHLLVATGLAGRLYRLDADHEAGTTGSGTTGSAEILYESADSHVRTVEVVAGGRVLLGTAGQGLVLELADGPAKGKKKTVAVTTLYDAVQPEVLGFTSRADGTAYVAVVASEASRVDLSKKEPPKPKNGESKNGDEGQVTVTTTQDATVGSRGSGASGPRSLVLEIKPDGAVEELLDFKDETVHSLLWHDEALWIGTGEEGRLYRYAGKRLVLERDLEERQVTALVGSGTEAAAVTTNAAALYKIPGGGVAEGSYTSAVLDAGQVAQFGSFLWEGEMPNGAALTLEVRSGMSSTPDATWTPWKTFSSNGSAGARQSAREVALGDLPRGRFVQWRAGLSGGGGKSPRLLASELSYRQQNLKPQIESLEVLDPGEVLVPSNFNPQNQTFEPWSPNREGIFTSLKPEKDKDASRYKTLWKKGYRSLRWKATDANEDKLVSHLAFRRDAEDGPWLPIVEKLDDAHYSFDATVLPDGVYRFRLTVSDAEAQTDAEALAAEKVSEPVVIDHSPPVLKATRRRGKVLEVELGDALSPLRHVAYSIDASPWESVGVEDGLLDGRHEVARIEVPEKARMILLRATDAAFNVVTFDLLGSESP